ncbi:hypothetical protein DdX_03610 [Ditylenchus destructor]|uniref:Uncharacterized protein n=1 Tax=Ditylenchus destructor TaxID=166010 RepID=A0AAD4NAF4_9BILA|nr:hypothetical protein DdX_03610 [Ditylenchus destructor]
MDLPQEMLATSHAAEGTEQNANIDEASAVNRCNRKRRPKIHPIWKNFKEVRKPLARIFVCEMNIQLKMIYNSDAEDYNPIYLIAAALDPNTIGILSDIDLNTAAEWICKMLPSEQLMQEVPSVYHLKFRCFINICILLSSLCSMRSSKHLLRQIHYESKATIYKHE